MQRGFARPLLVVPSVLAVLSTSVNRMRHVFLHPSTTATVNVGRGPPENPLFIGQHWRTSFLARITRRRGGMRPSLVWPIWRRLQSNKYVLFRQASREIRAVLFPNFIAQQHFYFKKFTRSLSKLILQLQKIGEKSPFSNRNQLEARPKKNHVPRDISACRSARRSFLRHGNYDMISLALSRITITKHKAIISKYQKLLNSKIRCPWSATLFPPYNISSSSPPQSKFISEIVSLVWMAIDTVKVPMLISSRPKCDRMFRIILQ